MRNFLGTMILLMFVVYIQQVNTNDHPEKELKKKAKEINSHLDVQEQVKLDNELFARKKKHEKKHGKKKHTKDHHVDSKNKEKKTHKVKIEKEITKHKKKQKNA